MINSYSDEGYGDEGGYGGGGYGGGSGGYGDPQGGGNPSLKTFDSLNDLNNFIKESNDQATVVGYIDSSFETDLSAFEEVQSAW